MLIRKMKAQDIAELAELYKQFWNESSCVEKMHKQFDKLNAAGMHVFLSAVEQGKLVGSVMGIICEELYGECKPFMVLENMVVDKKCRNMGIGKALVYELEGIAAQRGCTHIILVTENDRTEACKFYESVGYTSATHRGYKKKLNT